MLLTLQLGTMARRAVLLLGNLLAARDFGGVAPATGGGGGSDA